MISFESDYTTGAHPEILRKLTETNMEMMSGYGSDRYCISAREKIRAACGSQEADVQFLTGGTQTNALVISMMLKDYEGVIAAQTGHINVHEAGAIENTGHKVMTLPQHNGRIDPEELETYVRDYYQDETYEHMVFSGMVYISHPTEYGTLYRRAELEKLSEICSRYNMKLYMDGARLGYGLASLQTDVTLQDITRLCDVFYIGGTKVGALCGEAVVFTRNNTPDHFLNLIKRRGALLAKGRLLGVQFDTLFTDDLYFKISRHAVDKAEELKQIFRDKGYEFFLESPTNQQFVIIGNNKMEKLKEKVAFGFWEKYDGEHTVVRFATSWSTTDQDMEYLRSVL